MVNLHFWVCSVTVSWKSTMQGVRSREYSVSVHKFISLLRNTMNFHKHINCKAYCLKLIFAYLGCASPNKLTQRKLHFIYFTQWQTNKQFLTNDITTCAVFGERHFVYSLKSVEISQTSAIVITLQTKYLVSDILIIHWSQQKFLKAVRLSLPPANEVAER